MAQQPLSLTHAAPVGNWVAREADSETHLNLRPDGRFSFFTLTEGRTRASMGPYQTTAEAIELHPGTTGAQHLPYTVLGPDRLRLMLTNGAALVFTRSREGSSNLNFIAAAPGSSADVRVFEGGTAPRPFIWTNTFGDSWTNFPHRAAASPAAGAPQPSDAGIALPGRVPTPDWLAKALANQPPTTRPGSAPSARAMDAQEPRIPATETKKEPASASQGQAKATTVAGLSAEDLAMADAVIAENTLTLSLPGLGTTKDGPGPLTQADRLVLLALKFYHQRKALVPFSELRTRLEEADLQPRYRQVAEEFWAWYREAAQQGKAGDLGGYKSEFSTYIAMKNTARRKAANRVLAAQVASNEAWRRAMMSDREFRDRVAGGAAGARRAREDYLREWQVQANEAAAAEKEWQLYLTLGAGHTENQ